jgi:hypothetical protein
MLERFTEGARRVIILALEECRRFREIGPERKAACPGALSAPERVGRHPSFGLSRWHAKLPIRIQLEAG